MCVNALCTRVCGDRPKVDIRSLPLPLSTLFIMAGLLLNLDFFHHLGEFSCSTNLLSLPSESWVRQTTMSTQMVFWGFKFYPSCVFESTLCRVGWLSGELWGSTCLHFHSAESMSTMPSFYCGFWELDSGPCAFKGVTLLIKDCPQSVLGLFET